MRNVILSNSRQFQQRLEAQVERGHADDIAPFGLGEKGAT
jgi:hypothetical protein